MKLHIIIIGATVILSSSFFLKLCHFIHTLKEKKQYEESLESFNLLDKDISYKKYQKISRRMSVPNNPIRSTGDFLDFIISNDNSNDISSVENTLFKANCGDFRNE